jgi:hypothetical protein
MAIGPRGLAAAWLMIGAALVALPAAAQFNPTAPVRQPSADKRDFGGVWTPDQSNIYSYPPPGQRQHPPLKGKYAEAYEGVLKAAAAGQVINDPGAACIPGGMPRIMVNPYPMEILHNRDRLTILFEYQNQVRRLFLDGRKHPSGDDLYPTYLGDSIGRWEGDALVVETIGLRADTMFDATGIPHSDKLTVSERIYKESPTKLVDEITAIDPEALSQPWTVKRTYSFRSDWQVMENICLENNRNPVDANGVTRTILADGVVK